MKPELHPDNKNFSWTIPSGPYTYLSTQQIEHFNSEGYLILEDAFKKTAVDSLISFIDEFELEVTQALRQLDEGKFFISRSEEITFSTHLVTKSEELREFSKNILFAQLCKDLIGDNVRLYWDQAVYKKPGTEHEFPWHQDNGYTYIEPQAYLTLWIALTDTDETNGCPWVLPGLHKLGTLKHEITNLGYEIALDSSDAVCLPLKAGSIAVFSSLTPHRTGPNISDNVRKTYILQYAPDGAVRKISHSLTEPVNDHKRQFFIVEKGCYIN